MFGKVKIGIILFGPDICVCCIPFLHSSQCVPYQSSAESPIRHLHVSIVVNSYAIYHKSSLLYGCKHSYHMHAILCS